MSTYIVAEGDCIESIASMHGVTWDSIWNHSANRALKDAREDPNVLLPGDEVFVPDIKAKSVSEATEKKHRFRRKGIPPRLRLKIIRPPEEDLEDEGSAVDPDGLDVDYEDPEPGEEAASEPWANERFTVDVGKLIEGKTDGDGLIDVSIPTGAQSATVIIAPGTDDEMSFQVRLGALDPVDSPTGLSDRLNNLGFGPGDRPVEMSGPLKEALRDFQIANALDVTGEVDDATKSKLIDLHGS